MGEGGGPSFRSVRKTPLFEPFIDKNEHFTKTGSGKNIGKTPKRVAFCAGSSATWRRVWRRLTWMSAPRRSAIASVSAFIIMVLPTVCLLSAAACFLLLLAAAVLPWPMLPPPISAACAGAYCGCGFTTTVCSLSLFRLPGDHFGDAFQGSAG
jgi:hypothetical protein